MAAQASDRGDDLAAVRQWRKLAGQLNPDEPEERPWYLLARHRAERVARPTYDRLEDIAALWEGCGLTELRTAVLELSLEFPSVEDLWLPFLGGSTGFSAFARDLNRETGGAVAKRLREMIEAEYGTSEFMLTARAWAVAGRAAT